MPEPAAGPTPEFADLFGRLLVLLASPPVKEEGIREVLDKIAARVVATPALIEAGIENDWAGGGDPLKERLQIRRVDAVQISAGATAEELLALARALADDTAPIPITAAVRVQLLPDRVEPLNTGQRLALSDPALATVPRARPGDELAHVIEGILREIEQYTREGDWRMVLHSAQAALRMLPGLGEDSRRIWAIALKRIMTRPVVDGLIQQAFIVPEEQPRTTEVLRAGGLPAAEQVLDVLKKSDTVGPRAFLADALAGMPEALQIVVPLVKSSRAAEVRLGAELLGRLGAPQAVSLLANLVQHSDERVRLAAVDALGHYRDKAAVEPLRQALGHQSPAIRARAGRALAARGSGAIAMPLLAALESERDPAAWDELLEALVAIDAPEAAAALARIALQKRKVFGLGGALIRRQLAVVRALTESKSTAAKQALARIAAEGEGEVAKAAEQALAAQRA